MEFFEPRINQDTAAFWEGCRAHELRFQKCRRCGRMRWPGAWLCPDCLSEETELVTLPPEGTVYAYVVMERPFHPSVADKVPYIIATVDLTPEVRILANVLDCPPDGIHCGDKVQLTFVDSETYSRPVIRMGGGV